MRYQINSTESINVTKHSGKMEGIRSISTYKGFNETCKRLSSNKDSICSKCYVDKTIKRYDTQDGNSLTKALIDNHYILMNRLLKKEEIIRLNLFNDKYFRFESFGDLNNMIQLENYINIAKHYKTTQFALFTKHYNLIVKWFKSGKKMPKNINIVLSEIYLNNPLCEYVVNLVKSYHKNTISFVVYDKKTADSQGVKINCQKKCKNCLNCYKPGKKFDVVEELK